MTQITRNTQVVSVSFPKGTVEKLDSARKTRSQTRSAFLKFLLDKEVEDQRWEKIFKTGEKTKRKMKITSEADIDRILHAEQTS
jgi:metal-responsive CopG/Arc/MetJ family transcriptional regulator